VNEYYLIAKIISASSEGFVNISLFTDFPEHLYELKKVYLDFFDNKKEFRIDKIECSGSKYQIKFENFNDESDVGILIGKEIFIEEKDLIKLPDNHYFIHDIIGSVVLKNNVKIGKVTDVLSLPANDVYVVTDNAGNEILIPAVKDYIESFDPGKKIMKLKPGEDIYDTDEN
jgi:16S rRNA processing protein RimM